MRYVEKLFCDARLIANSWSLTMLYSTSKMRAIRMFSSGNAYIYAVCAELGKNRF